MLLWDGQLAGRFSGHLPFVTAEGGGRTPEKMAD